MSGSEHIHQEISGQASIHGPAVQARDIGELHIHYDGGGRGWARTQSSRLLGEVTDPFDLEVHHSIDPPAGSGSPSLPVYVPRAHDRVLGEVVAQAAEGASRIAVLVGGSSTGKTRACWEALAALRRRDEPWRLWHPIDPTRPQAALAELPDITPHTVVWLNEAQYYLAPDTVGEQVAAGLRNLLRDPGRRPVLVLATLWPEHWVTLTGRTGPDPHAHARELLVGGKISVPDAFTSPDLAALADRSVRDARLAEAAEQAADGEITQYLAGVPVLLDRYQEAPPATRAVIRAAMDARRLGAGPHLPWALLEEAAPGYLTRSQWDRTGDGWQDRARDYVTQPCNGVPAILLPVKADRRNQRGSGTPTPDSAAGSGTGAEHGGLYLLADYLDQQGRRPRADLIPPIDFWTAAAAHAHHADLRALGNAARARGLYRDAAQLHQHATAHGDPFAPGTLVRHLYALHPGDPRPARYAVTHVPVDDPRAVADLLNALRTAESDEVAALLAHDPAGRAPLDDPYGVAGLLEELCHATLSAPSRARNQRAALLARDPARHVSVDNPLGVSHLLHWLRYVGAREQQAVLSERAAAHVLDTAQDADELLDWVRAIGALELGWLRAIDAHHTAFAVLARAVERVALDDPGAVGALLELLQELKADDQVAALVARGPAGHVPLDQPSAVAQVLRRLSAVDARDQVLSLAERAARHVPLDDPGAVGTLIIWLSMVGAGDPLATLLARMPTAQAPTNDTSVPGSLLSTLRRVGAYEHAAALLARDPAAHVRTNDPGRLADFLHHLRDAGAHDQVSTLLARDPAAHVTLDDPYGVTSLLDALRAAGARDQVARLLARSPAAHASLDDPYHVGRLLGGLRRAGADDQVRVLLARDPAARIALDRPGVFLDLLLEELEQAGERVRGDAGAQLAALAERLPAVGKFGAFLQIGERAERYSFGREPDGSPAAPWGWDDLTPR